MESMEQDLAHRGARETPSMPSEGKQKITFFLNKQPHKKNITKIMSTSTVFQETGVSRHHQLSTLPEIPQISWHCGIERFKEGFKVGPNTTTRYERYDSKGNNILTKLK